MKFSEFKLFSKEQLAFKIIGLFWLLMVASLFLPRPASWAEQTCNRDFHGGSIFTIWTLTGFFAANFGLIIVSILAKPGSLKKSALFLELAFRLNVYSVTIMLALSLLAYSMHSCSLREWPISLTYPVVLIVIARIVTSKRF